MKDLDIYVIHEYGIPAHYKGLAHLKEEANQVLYYYNFRFFKDFIKAILYRDYAGLCLSLRSCYFFISCFIRPSKVRNKIVVLGCAPLDWRFIFLLRVLRESKNIYHTSWHCWDGAFYPKTHRFKLLNKILSKRWKVGLENKFNAIAAVTDVARQSLLDNYSLDKVPIETVYHAYEDELFYNQTTIKSSNDSLKILFVGRFVKCKGVELIIQIAARLPGIQFTLIGDGPLKGELIKDSNKNILIQDFTSSRTDLSKLMRSQDILIQPSLRTQDWEELFGMAIIEGMASGLVPITTSHAGPKSILSNTFLEGNLLHEDFLEEKLVSDFVKAISKYNSNFQLLVDHKKYASEIAMRYTCKSISKRWESILASIEEL